MNIGVKIQNGLSATCCSIHLRTLSFSFFKWLRNAESWFSEFLLVPVVVVVVVDLMPLLLLLLLLLVVVLRADAVDCISADLESVELTLVLVVVLLLLPAPNRNGLLGSAENPTVVLLPLWEADPKPANEENKPVPDDV